MNGLTDWTNRIWMLLLVCGWGDAVSAAGQLAPGYPSRAADLDALPGFREPPPGYGQVPFWWWNGEDLDLDRLLWQVRELHAKGISGVQVNYSHTDGPGWPTDEKEPRIFSEDWWNIYSKVSEACGDLGMGIGLSTYTLDWPNGGKNLFYELFYSKPEWNAKELVVLSRKRLAGGQTQRVELNGSAFAVWAYPIRDGMPQPSGRQLASASQATSLDWTAPEGEWELFTFGVRARAGSFDAMMKGAGEIVVRGFYQEFQNRNPGKSAKGLNFFFNDELQVGLGKFAWSEDFADEFKARKGYELFERIPAMWEDIGDVTPKVRIDYADVRMSLMEERYFEPIYNWHAERGITFGCDNHGRGLDPHAYGDYFRATRWYAAPGHDTPGGRADLIKGKVSSSIANLYQRPRVWLEGYHSLGWGATPENLMFATRENYLYGCSLLNLHGLYYSTYGSHWEWAPPCYHFHMPYWKHMGTFLKYFDRLSYLMSQGTHVADVAVMYPVTPYEAELKGNRAKGAAFSVGSRLSGAGIDFSFLDHQSLSRAVVDGDRLTIPDAKASFRTLIIPDMQAMRFENLKKAAEFRRAGGQVLLIGKPPVATDRAGRNDPKVEALVLEAFPKANRVGSPGEALARVKAAYVPDVRGLKGIVRALHRRVGPRDVYLVMDAKPGQVVEFRAAGAVELWDPWTGSTRALRVVKETTTGTQVELPLEAYEAQLVVFNPGVAHQNPDPFVKPSATLKTLPSEGWRVAFDPTMDNRWGDYRLPVTTHNEVIGLEARRFDWMRDHSPSSDGGLVPPEGGEWGTQLHGYGPQFYQLGPIPVDADLQELEARIMGMKDLDPAEVVRVGGKQYTWQPYEFSWRYGREGNPGHQGFHGLKGKLTDHFLNVGTFMTGKWGAGKLLHQDAEDILDRKKQDRSYVTYFWTKAVSDEAVTADLVVSTPSPHNAAYASILTWPVIAPTKISVNGQPVEDPAKPVALVEGNNPLLLRFDGHGEAYVVLRKQGVSSPEPKPLAMSWYEDPGLIRFDPTPDEPKRAGVEWFRFLSAPGTTAITIPVLDAKGVKAWCGGKAMRDAGAGRFEVADPSPEAQRIALRVTTKAGVRGGSAIPEPILVETSGQGVMPLGDWSKQGILHNYSGCVVYSKTVNLSASEAEVLRELDLGGVTATAELHVNGQQAGVRVAPPWRLNVEGLFKAGENDVQVRVYNTLANHYQTIPSHFKGDPVSGLMGPVRLLK